MSLWKETLGRKNYAHIVSDKTERFSTKKNYHFSVAFSEKSLVPCTSFKTNTELADSQEEKWWDWLRMHKAKQGLSSLPLASFSLSL